MTKTAEQYEMTFVLIEKDAATLEAQREEIKNNLNRRNVEVSKIDLLGNKPLFHEKNHHKRGNFNCWLLNAPKENIQQLRTDLSVNANILKSMIVKVG
ncbi:MAG: 30S ribosomal protein S6 [Spirochaetia bacterium]|nr:30S ribosomal protein S6 [Spirochaetia bacterium]